MKTYVITDKSGVVVRIINSNVAPTLNSEDLILAETNSSVPEFLYGKILIFKNSSFSYEDYPLQDLKNIKNEEINQSRLAANKNTFTFQGKQIACDDLSRSDIEGINGIVCLTGNLPSNFPGAWKTKDNSYVPIPNRSAWMSFYQAMVDQGVANFNKSQLLKTQLANATTVDQINAIKW